MPPRATPENDTDLPTLLADKLDAIIEGEQTLFAPEYDSDTETASISSSGSELNDVFTAEEFLAVIQDGNYAQIEAILNTCPNRKELINAKDKFGNSVLHFGAHGDLQNPALIRLLLQRGAHVNARNDEGHTPVITNIITTKRDDPSIVATLLFFGADPNVKIQGGITPLHLAMELGYRYIGQLLVKRGASLNSPDMNGVMPWEINRCMKLGLFQPIRRAPRLADPKLRKECMACGVFYKHVKCGGNCMHCGRVCCVFCLKKRVHISLLPPSFFRFSGGVPSTKHIRACTICRDILEERHRYGKSKRTVLARLFGNCERVF